MNELGKLGALLFLGAVIGVVFGMRSNAVEMALPSWYVEYADGWVVFLLFAVVATTAAVSILGRCSTKFLLQYCVGAVVVWFYPVVMSMVLFSPAPSVAALPRYFGPTYLGVVAIVLALWAIGLNRELRESRQPEAVT